MKQHAFSLAMAIVGSVVILGGVSLLAWGLSR